MRKSLKALTALCIFALLLPLCPARGLENEAFTPTPPRLRALLIGCDHFISQPDTWPAADNNLRLLSDTLITDSRRYALIRSYSGSIASVSALEEAVESAFQNAQEKDVSLIYIATHGVFNEEASTAQAALLLSDGQEEALLSAPELQDMLDKIAGTKVLILDACNSGAFIGKGLSGGADRVYFTGPQYKVLCSAGGSEASWYYQGGGDAASGVSYFATVLSQGLGAQGNGSKPFFGAGGGLAGFAVGIRP